MLVFINSSRLRTSAYDAVKAAAEAAVVAALAGGVATLVWRGPSERKAIAAGVFIGWAASTFSAAALMIAREISQKAFWLAFGGGMAFRAVVFIGLAAWVVVVGLPKPEALLVPYALMLLACLLIEYRRIKLK